MFPINLSFYCPSVNVHENQTIATFLNMDHLNIWGLIMLSLLDFCRLSNPTFPAFFVDHVFQASAYPHWSHFQSSASLLKHIPAEALSGSVSTDSKYLIYALPMRVNFPMKFNLNPFKHPFWWRKEENKFFLLQWQATETFPFSTAE